MKIATSQQRLNELFDSDPRNDTAIAADLGVAKQTLSAWRSGTRSPKKTVLIRIAETFHVSLEWLMGFDVNRDGKSENEPEAPRSEEARILARGIDKLSPEQREQALSVIRAMFASHADYFKKENDDET